MRKNATKLAAAVLSLAMVMTSVNMPASAAKTKVKLNKTKATLYVNGSASEKATTLKVTVNGKKVNATFKSSNTKVLTVAKSGKVTAKKNGTAKVTATYKKKKYNCTVTVKTYATSVSITSAKTLNLAAGKTATIKATVKPSTASNKKVSFTSSNKNVATVTSAGKVTAKKAGTATVTVKALGSKKAAKKATVKVNVKAAVKPSTEPTTTPTTEPTATPETPVATEGAITVTTNVTGAAVKVVSGTAVAAEANTGDGTTTTTKKVPVGSYELIVSKEGYKDARKTIVVNGDINESIELEKIATATTATVKAIGSKKIQVTYDGAVDPAKAKVSVKKGAVETDIESTTFSEDKTVATIETKARLIKGDYTITTAGVTEKDIVATLTAEDEKVAKIDVTTKTAPYIPEKVKDKTDPSKDVTVKRKASVDFVVLNQYGEDVTATYGGNISWTSSTSDAVDTSKASKGNLIISNGENDFVPGNKVYITGVYAQGGVAVNAEVTIGVEKKADEVIFKGVYNKTTKKIESLPAGFKNGRYALLFEVKDQYGNKMDATDITGNVTGDNGSLVFTSDNPLFISSEINESTSTFDVDDKTYLGVDLTSGTMAAKGGKATIQVISKVTGKISKYEINAESLSQVKTMTISAPQSISVVGEKVEIPFSAVDQNGNAVTNYKQLKEQMTLTASGGGHLYFKEADDGSAKLMFDALDVKGANDTVDAPVYLSTMVKDGGNFSNVLINVKAVARPVAVVGVDKNTATSIARGGSVVIKAENVLLQDQYGRTMDPKIVKAMIGNGDYQIKVESEKPENKTDASPFTVSGNKVLNNLSDTVEYQDVDSKDVTITKSNTTTGGEVFAVKIASKGNDDLDAYNALNSAEKISFSLLKADNDGSYKLVAGSEKVVTFSKVAQSEFVKYEADDLGVMYNDADNEEAPVNTSQNAKYNKTVNVYGIKEDGTKVAIPKEYFEVTTDADKKLDVTNNVISDVANGFEDTDFRENGAADGKVITKTVKVSIKVKDYVTGAIVTTLTKDLVLSKDDPKIATIGFKSEKDDPMHFVDKAKATAHATSGIIYDLSEYIKADDVKDQYGVKNAEGIKKDVAITISDIARGDESAFTVTENGSKKPVISGAVLGDKFKVTYSYAGGKSEVVNFTVGADNTPNWKLENTEYGAPALKSGSIEVTDGKLAAKSEKKLIFNDALVNASKTAIVDALKKAFSDSKVEQAKATYAWNEEGTELTVTVGSSEISGIASGDVTCNVTSVLGKKASVVILSSTKSQEALEQEAVNQVADDLKASNGKKITAVFEENEGQKKTSIKKADLEKLAPEGFTIAVNKVNNTDNVLSGDDTITITTNDKANKTGSIELTISKVDGTKNAKVTINIAVNEAGNAYTVTVE